MKTKFALFFILSLSLLTGRVWAQTVSYDQKVLVDNNPVATIKVIAKDGSMRAESDFNGVKSMLFRNPKGTYTYLPEQKLAALMPPELDRPNITRDIPNLMDFLNKSKGEKTGTETVNGVECDIYTFVEPNIQKPGRAWIWREKSFPVKIEVDAPEGKTSIEITNINFAPTVQDSDFEIPADAKIFDPTAAIANQSKKAAAEKLDQQAAKLQEEAAKPKS